LHVENLVVSSYCSLLKRCIGFSRSFFLNRIDVVLTSWNWHFNWCNWHWWILLLFSIFFSLKRTIIIILTLIIWPIINYIKTPMIRIRWLSKKWRRELIMFLRFRIVPDEVRRSILIFFRHSLFQIVFIFEVLHDSINVVGAAFFDFLLEWSYGNQFNILLHKLIFDKWKIWNRD